MNVTQYLSEMRALGFDPQVVRNVSPSIKRGILQKEPDLATEWERKRSYELEAWRQKHLTISELANDIEAADENSP